MAEGVEYWELAVIQMGGDEWRPGFMWAERPDEITNEDVGTVDLTGPGGRIVMVSTPEGSRKVLERVGQLEVTLMLGHISGYVLREHYADQEME